MAEQFVAGSVSFQLVRLGQVAGHRLVGLLAPMGLRPRHCVVLELLRDGPMAQLELARQVGVAPSVVVDMVDELQSLHAVTRVRDAADRRRQYVELTAHGRDLLRRVANAARRLDTDLLRELDSEQRDALRAALSRVAGAATRPAGQPVIAP